MGYENHPRVLVGFERADDASVYLLEDGSCLVQSLDFFTPVVDDPYEYGYHEPGLDVGEPECGPKDWRVLWAGRHVEV